MATAIALHGQQALFLQRTTQKDKKKKVFLIPAPEGFPLLIAY